ncbi:MAG: hypothetical protein ACTSPI_00105 [Candidatus Heimdallarchaeaceae archaeon]
MLDKYDFKKLAEKVADEFIDNGTPINVTIKKVSIQGNLNPEQIKRLTEFSNADAYNKIYDSSDDKAFKFEVGDSDEIIKEIYDEDKPISDSPESETEIKDMAPVQFDDAEEVNESPVSTVDYLGDEDELEASKMDIPRKDYIIMTDEPSGDSDREEEEVRGRKEAGITKEACLTKFAEVKKELDNRIILMSDDLLDEFKKTSSLFNTPLNREKFTEFQKRAYYVHEDYSHIRTVIKDLAKMAHIAFDEKVDPAKFASENDYGIQHLDSLVDMHKKYVDTLNARQYIDENIKGI